MDKVCLACIISHSDFSTLKAWRLVNHQCQALAKGYFSRKIHIYKSITDHEISEEFIREYLLNSFRFSELTKDDWGDISFFVQLSENFIREFQNYVDWDYISAPQILSENFIREFAHKVNWRYISQEQELSDTFIQEFKDQLYWSIMKFRTSIRP